MSSKDIEYISLLINNASKILVKKVDSDMTFLHSIVNNPQFLSKKIDEIKTTLSCYTDLLTTGHLLSIEYLKYSKDNIKIKELLSLLDSIKVPFKYFDNLFKNMKINDISKIYKEFIKVSDSIKSSISSKHKGGYESKEFKHTKIILGGETYISNYRSEMLLFDLVDKNKYTLSDDELNFMLKDLFQTNDIDNILINLKTNFNIKTLMSMFKIDMLLNIQLDKYKLLESDIKKYFDNQKNKYIKTLERPEKVEGACEIILNDHIKELTELDIKCVDSVITQYIIDITNIKSENDLKVMADKLLNMISDSEYLDRFKYRKTLKVKISKLHNNFSDILSDKKINEKVLAIFPSDKSKILLFLIETVENLMPDLKRMEKTYDECATIISEIIETWKIIIGPDTTPCILHTANIMKLHIGSKLLKIIADKKFNNNNLASSMESISSRVEKNILGSIDLAEVYSNKFEWENITNNISNLLRM